MDRAQFRGIAFGASTFVLMANLFQYFLGWEMMAVFIGLIIGLEVGFWSWNPKATLDCQKEYLGTALEDSLSLLEVIAKVVGPKILEFLNILMYVGVASAAIWWASFLGLKSLPIFSWMPSWDILKEGPLLWTGYLAIGLMAMIIQSQIIKEIEIDSFGKRKKRSWDKAVLWRVVPLFLNVLLSPLSVPIFTVILMVFAFWLIVTIAIYAPMLGLLELGRRQRLVPAGVIIGGFCGLAYGWTNLAPTMTALAMITAGSIGCLSAWAINQLASSKKFFKAVHDFSDWVPFADGPTPLRIKKAK